MIDTVVLRIHDVKKYRSIVKTIDLLNKKGHTTQSAKVDGKEFRKLMDNGHKLGESLEILKMNGSGEFLVKTKFVKHAGASSHYNLAWAINYTANFIELNFSIPKYVYGSNILMFVDHLGDRSFDFTSCSQLRPNFERTPDLFGRFLNEFFRK